MHYVQALPGVTLAQASNSSFVIAFTSTVADVLGIAASTVTGVTVAASRRTLLSGVIISYSINVPSSMTPVDLIAKLKYSVSSESFSHSLSSKSGISITDAAIVTIENLSPTTNPSPPLAYGNRGNG